ncbi:MAG: response regulator, partial [Nitrospirae bacterium]
TVLDANLVVASLCNTERVSLVGRTFHLFVRTEDRDIFHLHLKDVFKSKGPRSCELRLLSNGRPEICVQCESIAVEDPQQGMSLCRTSVIDITERKRMEIEQATMLRRREEINLLQQSFLSAATIDQKLKSITDCVVRIFGADFCRIWLIRPGDRCDQGCVHAAVQEGPHVCRFRDRCLHLLAGSGRYTHINGEVHRRVPFGCYKIGTIASGADHKFLTNDVANDPRVHNHDWAKELGLVSFAGYQLRVPGGESMGVMALFAKHTIGPDEDAMLDGLSSTAALVIQQAGAEEALRKSEEFNRNILEGVGEGFIVIDPEYKIISANRAYCEQVKLSCEDIVGKHCYEVSHHMAKPCFQEGEDCSVKHTFETGTPHFAVHTHFDKDGNRIYIESRSFPMKDASGKVYAVIETLNNITEKRGLEEQLRHTQKMEAIGTLAGGIAHDFNNILNVIIGYGGLMQMKMKPDDPQMAQLREILAAGDRATHLTRGLLAFSRKQVMEIRAVNINEIVSGFKRMLARIIGEDIELQITLSEKDLILKADIVQIEQVLMNLAANARDVMPKGGVLTVSAMPLKIDREFIALHHYGELGRYALISVSDTGSGMDEKTKNRIFEPFFTTKELGRGTGLGLSIVYGIIKQHNGFINCYSEPGKGTTFRIYLPLIKGRTEDMKTVEVAVPTGGTETILLAEDDPNVRTLLKNTLERFGYVVHEAVDGEDAVNKFKENKDKIRLLLLDIIMPRKNGKDAYEDIKGIKHDIKAVFISGYAMDIIQRFGIEEGFEFISKPVMPNELLRKVREALDK